MKIARFKHQQKEMWGVIDTQGAYPLPGATDAASAWRINQERAGAGNRDAGTSAIPLDQIKWLAPVTAANKFLCVGLNYRAHADEMGRNVAPHPSIFVRFADSVVGHQQPVIAPFASEQFDYEAELVVVIGRTARHVTEAEALDYVGGYTCLAENSVRDYQKHQTQATPGKNFEQSGALGPWIVDASDVPNVGRSEVIGRLNGEVVQHGQLSQMIYPIPKIIAYASIFTTLRPGDIIATGTPEGVGASRKPPLWMRAGDTFEVEIPGVGLLRNPVAAEQARSAGDAGARSAA